MLHIVNGTAMNTGVYVFFFFRLEFSSFLDICPGVELLDNILPVVFFTFSPELFANILIMTILTAATAHWSFDLHFFNN